MLDIGWSELILIGVVALIVIGPKDLPDMFRQLGRFTAKLRSMARDFSRAMEQAANETGMKDVAKDLRSVTSPQSLGLNAMKDAASKFERWDPLKNAATPTKSPLTATVPAATSAPVGPETQALLDKQAARQAIIAESTGRLRALNSAGPAVPASSTLPIAPALTAVTPVTEAAALPKPRVRTAKPSKSADADVLVAPAKSPAKRKPKKVDEA